MTQEQIKTIKHNSAAMGLADTLLIKLRAAYQIASTDSLLPISNPTLIRIKEELDDALQLVLELQTHDNPPSDDQNNLERLS